MARRNGRPGDYLLTDDITGFVIWGSQAKRGYYGEIAKKPFRRNLQEIASPIDDPQPVSIYRGPDYETISACVAEVAPPFVGNTTVPTSPYSAAYQVLNLNPAIPDMEVGCTFVVR